jgi:hypothetical protein
MNRHSCKQPTRAVPPSYRRAFEQLNMALEKNTPSNNAEKIQLMRLALFGDVVKLEQSGRIVIPK